MITMTNRQIVKKIVNVVVTTSVAFTVSSALKVNTPAVKPHHKVEAYVGSFIVGSMVADKAGTYTDGKVDAFFDWIDSVKKDIKSA